MKWVTHFVVNVDNWEVISTWNPTTNKTHIWTINSKPVWGWQTLEELKNKYPKDAPYMMILTSDQTDKIVKEKTYEAFRVWQWTETTEEEYMDMLEVLPPEKWERTKDMSIFRMCEYQTWSITRHYKKVFYEDWNHKYYTGNFDVSSYSTYADII